MNPRMKRNLQMMPQKAQQMLSQAKAKMPAMPKMPSMKPLATGKQLAKPLGMGVRLKKRLGGAANRLMNRNYSR